jgi:hypothetical protein
MGQWHSHELPTPTSKLTVWSSTLASSTRLIPTVPAHDLASNSLANGESLKLPGEGDLMRQWLIDHAYHAAVVLRRYTCDRDPFWPNISV